MERWTARRSNHSVTEPAGETDGLNKGEEQGGKLVDLGLVHEEDIETLALRRRLFFVFVNLYSCLY